MLRRLFSVRTFRMKAKTIILNKKFAGVPQEENFKLVEEELPALKDGEFLAQAQYLSVDPYMRLFSDERSVGKPLIGEQVAKIIDSKNPNYPIGEYVVGEFGWRTHTIATNTNGIFYQYSPRILKNYENLPKSLALGTLGMIGTTAYFGFLQVCKPKVGDTVVISGAGGAVGITVGQIAKLKGCRVVGITGSNEKGQRLIKEAGFDAFVNYKLPTFENDLEKATPNKIDCYFDNVGGEVSSSVLYRMNKFGRIAICGAVSFYNGENALAREVQTPIKTSHSTMEGFHVKRWKNEWDKAVADNTNWVKQGKLKYFETVTEGFENSGKALIGVFAGKNFGKAIVKV